MCARFCGIEGERDATGAFLAVMRTLHPPIRILLRSRTSNTMAHVLQCGLFVQQPHIYRLQQCSAARAAAAAALSAGNEALLLTPINGSSSLFTGYHHLR